MNENISFSNKVPKYIYALIPYIITFKDNQRNLFIFIVGEIISINLFLQCVMSEWNKLDLDKRSCIFYNSFFKALLAFFKPIENKFCNFYDENGIKLVTSLRLGLSFLRDYKF